MIPLSHLTYCHHLHQVLLTHVVPGAVLSSDLTNDQLAETAAANSLRINIYSKLPNYTPFVTVNGKRVEKADVEANNGVNLKTSLAQFINVLRTSKVYDCFCLRLSISYLK